MGKYMPILFGSSCQAAKTCYQNDCWGQKVWPYLTIVSEFKITEHQKNLYLLWAKLMYKYYHDLFPSVFSDFCVHYNSVHEYHTRQENLLHVLLIRTTPLSKSVRVTGVSLYNHFKSLICLKVSYVTYKYNLKRHIIVAIWCHQATIA